MKRNILVLILLLGCFVSQAQIGVGVPNPAASAAFEVKSTTQGLLYPRLTIAQRDAIASPAPGLTIYNTTKNCLEWYTGIVWYNGCGNQDVSPTTNGSGIISSYSCSTASAGTMAAGSAVSGVTQTIMATVSTLGTYSISTIANGVTFSGSGTFAVTGAQNVVLTASGTPVVAGTSNFVLNTVPNCSFSRGIAASCGAYVAAGVYKVFMCHNLGADDTSLDPNVPVQGIHGNYYQWGRSIFVATSSTSSGTIGTWNTTAAANGAWADTGTKTANDPCPTGFRVPTSAQWEGVVTKNTVSFTGTWTNSATNFGAAISFGPDVSTKTLTLPAAGWRSDINGALANRGSNGYYWSSTENSTVAYNLSFDSSDANPSGSSRTLGFSVRCVSE